MKRKENKSNIKGLANGTLKICPVCGFSFRAFDPLTRKKINICPMCGFKFVEPNIFPEEARDSDKKFLF